MQKKKVDSILKGDTCKHAMYTSRTSILKFISSGFRFGSLDESLLAWEHLLMYLRLVEEPP